MKFLIIYIIGAIIIYLLYPKIWLKRDDGVVLLVSLFIAWLFMLGLGFIF